MNWGDFRELFTGVAWKRLTPHEVDASVSNGHEFQGVNGLRLLLGTDDAERLTTTYMILRDEPDDVERIKSWSKWYDCRRNQQHRSAEWRLYYPAEAGQIQSQMKAGDLMVLLATRSGTLLILMAPKGSGRERELVSLFDIVADEPDLLRVREFNKSAPVDFLAASILESLGISRVETPVEGDSLIVSRLVDELLDKHAEALPPGAAVAALVRSRLSSVDPLADPDAALMRWIEAEAVLYRSWEDRKIGRRLERGFALPSGEQDIEGFREFSMSLRQSRVSRAGGALQYHFRELLDAHRISYVMEPVVDKGERPDFLFPGKREYDDPEFPATRLRMLAAKFTAKDRWRQVLNEAKRIAQKHLLTLETGISNQQLQLMEDARLVLVLPSAVRSRYGPSAGIMVVREFLSEVACL